MISAMTGNPPLLSYPNKSPCLVLKPCINCQESDLERSLKFRLSEQQLCSVHSENASLGFYSRLLGPVSDHDLINRVSKERALDPVMKYSHGAI